MKLEANVSVHKVGKHAAGESGDTAEIVERAGGGFSVVVVDGQGSGRGAKALSLLISTRAVSLLKDGMRDRTAIEGVHDFLVAHRNGLVSATIDIITLTPADRSISIIRQASVPNCARHRRWLRDVRRRKWTHRPLESAATMVLRAACGAVVPVDSDDGWCAGIGLSGWLYGVRRRVLRQRPAERLI